MSRRFCLIWKIIDYSDSYNLLFYNQKTGGCNNLSGTFTSTAKLLSTGLQDRL